MKKKTGPAQVQPPAPTPLTVLLSASAQEQFTALRTLADANPASATAAIWKAVDRLIREILPHRHLALAAGTALGKRTKPRKSDFTGIRRLKFGERGRFFFVASNSSSIACVLFLGTGRKAGDKNDPYEELSRRLAGGEFDAILDQVGVKRPKGYR